MHWHTPSTHAKPIPFKVEACHCSYISSHGELHKKAGKEYKNNLCWIFYNETQCKLLNWESVRKHICIELDQK
ncbi:hypothetical protein TNCT_116281 [Trichonephila clavata]|uniref:Uncharacterized protein n=1 Tax=Trichonephila clavata TaxID=2740835 RepID=A0A8X6ILI1_TRICU|nr:hypothetical protein TNCT_116281 [Trichonephila clavata]